MWRLTASPLAEREASALGDALLDADEFETCTASAFESGDGWMLDALFTRAPDGGRLEAFVEALIGRWVPISLGTVAQEDWVALSLKALPPIVVARFVVHGSHDRGRLPPGALGLEIDAALAFGTGHHGTTQACLEALCDLAKRKRPLRILDLGTGTGVLAMAAARLWRRPVLASDIDPVSVRLARSNARRNGLSPFLQVIQATGFRSRHFRERAPFDLVLANILAGPLVRLARPMRELLAPGAGVVLSGLLPSQEARVLAAYRTAAGLRLERRLWREGWSTLVLSAPGRRSRAHPAAPPKAGRLAGVGRSVPRSRQSRAGGRRRSV